MRVLAKFVPGMSARCNDGRTLSIIDLAAFHANPGVDGNWVVYHNGYPLADIECGRFTSFPEPRGRYCGKPNVNLGRKCKAKQTHNPAFGRRQSIGFPRLPI